MRDHRCDWQEAAECVGLQLAFFPANERMREPLHVLRMNLSMMCRAQFAAERSYARFVQGQSTSGIESILSQFLEAHAFLVSTDLAWETLAAIKLALVTLKPPKGFIDEIKSASARHADVRAQLASARTYVEHVTEGIRQRRAGSDGGETSAGSLRQPVGHCEGTTVVFGDERFDLAAQLAALADLRDTIAPSIASAVTPTF
jgi:hypothetical protein